MLFGHGVERDKVTIKMNKETKRRELASYST